jgi:hypothetical protein
LKTFCRGSRDSLRSTGWQSPAQDFNWLADHIGKAGRKAGLLKQPDRVAKCIGVIFFDGHGRTSLTD